MGVRFSSSKGRRAVEPVNGPPIMAAKCIHRVAPAARSDAELSLGFAVNAVPRPPDRKERMSNSEGIGRTAQRIGRVPRRQLMTLWVQAAFVGVSVAERLLR